MTQIRVHELASELNVGTQQVLTILEDVGQKVRGPSTVIGVSAAAKVRGRLRIPHPTTSSIPAPRLATADGHGEPGDDAVATGSGSLPGAAPQASLSVPPAPPVAVPVVVTGSTGLFANPFAVPAPRLASPFASPATPVPAFPYPVVNRVPPAPLVIEPAPDLDALWRERDITVSDQLKWLEAGLRPAEAEVADRCRSAGIAPEELYGKLSGRTALQRLRDGEAITSVWARIREAEQQPRRAGTKLTGRFQLN